MPTVRVDAREVLPALLRDSSMTNTNVSMVTCTLVRV
jgi:cell division protein FtsX